MSTLTMSEVAKSVSLTLQNNKHNKAYAASLEQADGGWVVNFSYGAIGSTQKPGSKTKSPLPYDKAAKIYDKLVAEKTEVPCDCCSAVYISKDAPAAVAVATDMRASDLHPKYHPELLVPTDATEAGRLIKSGLYGAQRKYNGVRMGISHRQGSTVAFNKLGKIIPVPVELKAKIATLMATALYDTLFLDGEYIAGEFVAYDILEYGVDMRQQRYHDRHIALKTLLKVTEIKVAELYTGVEAIMAMIEVEHANRGEGVVLKKLSAPYMPGKQGINFKLKFWESATVRICAKQKEDGKNSFAVEVFILPEPGVRAGVWAACGTVTCKGPLPAVGTYREVKYLYVGNGGNLYQPEDLGARTDVTDADCTHVQLKLQQDAPKLAE